MNTLHSLALVAVITAVTLLTRLLPFLLFGGKREPVPAPSWGCWWSTVSAM